MSFDQSLADALRETNARLTAQLAEARAEIDSAWFGIDHGWAIESRAEMESEAKTNGFKFGLAQAVHTVWKREPKVQAARAQAIAEVKAQINDARIHAKLDALAPAKTCAGCGTPVASCRANKPCCPDCHCSIAPAPPGAVLVSRWQPMETAPKDGTTVLIYCPGGIGVAAAAWVNGDIEWWHVEDGKHGPFPVRGSSPTHWMPLPGLPVEGQS